MAKIYISPSTQEHNVGAGDYGTEEFRMNQVADVVCSELTKYGIEWRRNKPEMTLQQVVADSNAYGPDIHFAIHSNASAEKKARGAEVHIYGKGGERERFAKIVYEKIAALTPTADRGVFISPHLYELAKTKAQAALIEIAFHDNPDDARFIQENIQRIGIALAEGIREYFGVDLDYKALYEELKPRYEEAIQKLDQIRKIGGWIDGANDSY